MNDLNYTIECEVFECLCNGLSKTETKTILSNKYNKHNDLELMTFIEMIYGDITSYYPMFTVSSKSQRRPSIEKFMKTRKEIEV